MCYMQYLLQAFVKSRQFRSEMGVTAIEYALIAGIAALAIVAGAIAIGVRLSGFFSNLAGKFPS